MKHRDDRRVWKMRGGTKVKWCEMELCHLRACADMIGRKAIRQEDRAWSNLNRDLGEYAEYAVQCEISSAVYASDATKLGAAYIRAYANWRQKHHPLPIVDGMFEFATRMTHT